MGAEGALTLAVLIGAGAAGLTLIARALAPLDWLSVRPMSCDLCCGVHGTWISLLLYWPELSSRTVLVGLGAVAVSVTALKLIEWLRRTEPPPPDNSL